MLLSDISSVFIVIVTISLEQLAAQPHFRPNYRRSMGDGMPNIDTGVPCHICPKGFEAEPACRQLIPKDFVLNPVTFWCNQCRPGYYQDIENSENPCRVCVSGPQDKYTIIVQNCTKQSNIQTACVEGYYMEIPNTRCILCPDHRKERLNSRAFEECFAFYELDKRSNGSSSKATNSFINPDHKAPLPDRSSGTVAISNKSTETNVTISPSSSKKQKNKRGVEKKHHGKTSGNENSYGVSSTDDMSDNDDVHSEKGVSSDKVDTVHTEKPEVSSKPTSSNNGNTSWLAIFLPVVFVILFVLVGVAIYYKYRSRFYCFTGKDASSNEQSEEKELMNEDIEEHTVKLSSTTDGKPFDHVAIELPELESHTNDVSGASDGRTREGNNTTSVEPQTDSASPDILLKDNVNCFQETINTAEPKHVLEKTSIIPSLDSSANSSRGPTPGDTFTSSDESDYSNNFIIIKGKMNKLNLTVNMDINEQFTSPMNGNERYASPKPAGIFNQLDRNKSQIESREAIRVNLTVKAAEKFPRFAGKTFNLIDPKWCREIIEWFFATPEMPSKLGAFVKVMLGKNIQLSTVNAKQWMIEYFDAALGSTTLASLLMYCEWEELDDVKWNIMNHVEMLNTG